MSVAAMHRFERLLGLGASVPPRQRAAYAAALDAAYSGADREAAALDDPRERVQREAALLLMLCHTPPGEPARSAIGSVSVDPEAARCFMESLHLPEHEARAIRATAGMPSLLADRLRKLAAGG